MGTHIIADTILPPHSILYVVAHVGVSHDSCGRELSLPVLQLGDHTAALRVLALELGDIRGAERYCQEQAGAQGRLALLRMLLAPGHGRAPLYAEACHLLAAPGTTARLPVPCPGPACICPVPCDLGNSDAI